MAAGSRRSFLDRPDVGTFVAACLCFVTVANAQIQQDVDRCAGKDGVTPDVQVNSCTAVIESRTYASKELAFAFNNRGLAHYAKREFDHPIPDFAEAIRIDPPSARGYGNRALAHWARGDLDQAIADYNQAIGLDSSSAFALN